MDRARNKPWAPKQKLKSVQEKKLYFHIKKNILIIFLDKLYIFKIFWIFFFCKPENVTHDHSPL